MEKMKMFQKTPFPEKEVGFIYLKEFVKLIVFFVKYFVYLLV